MSRDIETSNDIRLLVEQFYHKVMVDELTGPIFNEMLFFKWDIHIPVMIDFWATVLLQEGNYKGNSIRAHIELNRKFQLKPEHFARWKALFFETLDENFTGPKMMEAKQRVEMMEAIIQTKIAQSNNPNFIQ